MLDFQILRICQVFNAEEFLYFVDTLLSQVDDLVLLIDNEVSGLDDLLAHDGCHLSHFPAGLTALQLFCQNITDFVETGRLSALSGNNKRCSGLINQYGVNLINDGIVQISLYKLFFVDHHIVTKVIKSQLVVGHIRDIARILGTSLVIFHGVQNHTYGQSQELMHLAHPLRITVCQVIVDGNNVYAFAFQRV